MIKYYDRKTKSINTEDVAGSKSLNLIYYNHIGKKFLPAIASRKIYSDIYGHLCDLPISRHFIKSFINKFNIDLTEYEKKVNGYSSFNDFFYRKLSGKRPIDKDINHFISPCDSKLLAVENISEDLTFNIKGFTYNLKDLVKNDSISNSYKNGTCLIFRLAPTDYHRFHFVDSGKCSKSHSVKGRYYSVNPIALETIENVFCENKREYSIQQSDNFGELLYIEVGATFVGSIIETYDSSKPVNRFQEKGYFKFGGSTVIIFVKSNILKLDDDILLHSSSGIETKVLAGEKIGVRI